MTFKAHYELQWSLENTHEFQIGTFKEQILQNYCWKKMNFSKAYKIKLESAEHVSKVYYNLYKSVNESSAL